MKEKLKTVREGRGRGRTLTGGRIENIRSGGENYTVI